MTIIPENESEKDEVLLDFHTCGDEHQCSEECIIEGICELDLKMEKREWKNSFGVTKYDYYIQTPSKKTCNHKILPFKSSHEKDHDCQKKHAHQCDEQCPECKAFCQKPFGHSGNHYTASHRNKEQNIFLSTSKEKDIKIDSKGFVRKYKVGEFCEPEFCSESCLRKGRAHYHLKPCPKNKDPSAVCPAEANEGIRHSTQKFEPHPEITYDLWLCDKYWDSYKWEMPVDPSKRPEILSCNFYCGHSSHKESNEFCTLEAWHKGDHCFECVHEDDDLYSDNIDIVFVVDNTGSMSSYITESKNTINSIIDTFVKKKMTKNFLFGFVGYRDHPPQDTSYVTLPKDLSDRETIKKFISTVTASGGGDGPEAVLDGLYDAAVKMSWREDSAKFVIHIADAPPHGKLYVSSGDGFPGGCPCKLTIENIAAR